MGENTLQNCTRQNKKKNPGRKQACWGSLFCTNLTQPTGALDSRAAAGVMDLFESINREGQTILMVTHSIQAASHASRVLFIKDGEVYHQIYRGMSGQREMLQKISDTLTLITAGREEA